VNAQKFLRLLLLIPSNPHFTFVSIFKSRYVSRDLAANRHRIGGRLANSDRTKSLPFDRSIPSTLSFKCGSDKQTVLSREWASIKVCGVRELRWIDHFGGPMAIGPYAGKQAEIFEQWKLDVAKLATCQNVVAKLGGLAMPINGWGWNERETPATSDEIVAAHAAYYLHSIDCFGPDRCMFESNFPVDKLSVSYPVLWNALKKIAARFDEDEQTAMFRGTAERVYRLDLLAAC
jgi:hypothetical protein